MFYEGDQFWQVKKYLYQAKDQERKAAILKRRIDMRSVTDPHYDDLCDELEKTKEAQKKAEITVTDFISFLPANEQMVMIKRYIDGEPWEQIASEMNMTVRGVQKLHGQALPPLKEKYEEQLFPEEG